MVGFAQKFSTLFHICDFEWVKEKALKKELVFEKDIRPNVLRKFFRQVYAFSGFF